MLRRLAAVLAVAFAIPASAQAAGGNYVFEGASPSARSTVRAALNASSFDWGVVPQQITIHVGRYGVSHSTPGHVWLDRGLLASGRLGADTWCYEVSGLAHDAQGCERFASMVAWAYWPSKDNAYRPTSLSDESAAMSPGAFRALLSTVVGMPTPVFALTSR